MRDTLRAFLTHIETLHPKSIDFGLERITRVLARLLPEPFACPVVTIAGTNGKGSTATALTALGVAAGLRVGTFTSPHLVAFNERIAINHQPISDEALMHCFECIEAARGEITLTFFEYSTLAALKYFHDQKLDTIILEVGMGGRLDAVNAIDPDISIITHIGLDHTQWLGETLEAIAYEKAGILRAGRPVLIGDARMGAHLKSLAETKGAIPLMLGVDFQTLPFEGALHPRSLALAVEAARHLKWNINLSAMQKALQNLTLGGRFQVIPWQEKQVILDVAHNEDGIQSLAQRLQAQGYQNLNLVIGILEDKAVEPMLVHILPFAKAVYCCTPDSPRAMKASVLAEKIPGATPYDTPDAALDAALASPGDVLVTGSFYTVGSLMASHRLCYNLEGAGERVLC